MKTTMTEAGVPTLRVSHADREVCVDELQHGFEIGQLDQAEFEDRVEAALRAKSQSDLDLLVGDLISAKRVHARETGSITRRQITMGVAALACLIAGVAGVSAGSLSESPSRGACISTGLVSEADCPAPSAVQQRLIRDVETATEAATQAHEAANSAAKDSSARDWALKAEEAAARAASAERDAQAIVATSSAGTTQNEALKVPAKTAHTASSEAVKAALKAEAAAAGASAP